MNLSVITNGNHRIGYGHISRSLIVAESFKEKGHNVQFVVGAGCTFKDRIETNRLRVEEVNFIDSSTVIELLACFNTDVILIDCIESDYDSLSYLKKCRFFLVSITLFFFDLGKRYEHLSFFPSIKKSEILESESLIVCIGRSYLIFSKSFETFLEKEFNYSPKSVLITMGGSDPCNITWKVFNAVKKLNQYNFIILLSKFNQFYNQIITEADEKANISVLSFSPHIARLMHNADIVILNGGVTRYESCLTKTPFIAISIHDVQFNITKEIADYGVGVNLGVYKKLTENEIAQSVKDLMGDDRKRFAMYKKMKSLIDCKGVERVYNMIGKSYKAFCEKDNKIQ